MTSKPLRTIIMLLDDLKTLQPVAAANPRHAPAASVLPQLPIGRAEMEAAAARLTRWAPVLASLFPELQASRGIIESPILPLQDAATVCRCPVAGRALVKADHALPVAGSIKARGGLYEVLVYAEKVGVETGLMEAEGDPRALAAPEARTALSAYRVGVGSTGNLGLSIGIMAAALGFETVVHMSRDAKQWKKERLRKRGVRVVEHPGDFAAAVAAGRREMANDPKAHFVDDENSLDLFLGYSVAALRLEKQLHDAGIVVSVDSPLCVYLPCGVGGSPGGITWGLKQVYGDAVHCHFAEPVATPAFLVRMLSDTPHPVYDFGLDNKTEADGLAVAQASELVFDLVRSLIDGCYTVTDDELFTTLVRLEQTNGMRIEPSAAAGFPGPLRMRANGKQAPDNTTHLFWTTGGSFVPADEYRRFHRRGIELLQEQQPDGSP